MARVNTIALHDVSFDLKGESFEYPRVVSLEYFYLVTTVYGTGGGDKDHDARLDIWIDGKEKPVKIRSDMPLTYLTLNKTEKTARIVGEIFRDLARKTFGFRLARFQKMLDQYGYFLYDEKKFVPDGTVKGHDGRDMNLRTDRPIYREPFRIYHETEKTFAQKLAHLWTIQDFEISTRRDPDVFFYLLLSIYGLEFSTS